MCIYFIVFIYLFALRGLPSPFQLTLCFR